MAEKGKISDPDFLAEYDKECNWAEGLGISQRTAARYRASGLPFLEFGGLIWIPKRGGREWIANRVRRRNPRRQRQSANTEIGAA